MIGLVCFVYSGGRVLRNTKHGKLAELRLATEHGVSTFGSNTVAEVGGTYVGT